MKRFDVSITAQSDVTGRGEVIFIQTSNGAWVESVAVNAEIKRISEIYESRIRELKEKLFNKEKSSTVINIKNPVFQDARIIEVVLNAIRDNVDVRRQMKDLIR